MSLLAWFNIAKFFTWISFYVAIGNYMKKYILQWKALKNTTDISNLEGWSLTVNTIAGYTKFFLDMWS